MPAPFTRRTRGPGRHGYLKGGHCPPEYRIWVTMNQRCYNRNCREYPDYGGRGIKVCRRWLAADGFTNFLADVGRRQSPSLTLNRVNNDGPYAPQNVAWADRRTQQRNTRVTRLLTFRRRTQALATWAEEVGMKPITLLHRLRRGWTVPAALTTAVAHRRPYAEWKKVRP